MVIKMEKVKQASKKYIKKNSKQAEEMLNILKKVGLIGIEFYKMEVMVFFRFH